MRVDEISFECIRDPDEMLLLLRQVAEQIDDVHEHLLWTGSEIDHLKPILEFPNNQNPYMSIAARGEDKQIVGYLELHNFPVGCFIARVWAHNTIRRHGLGTRLFKRGLEEFKSVTTRVFTFCHFDNQASLNLQLDLGFELKKSFPDIQHHLLGIDLKS